MKCLGAMFFEEQAQIIMYMIFQVLSFDFRFKKFNQETISSNTDPCP